MRDDARIAEILFILSRHAFRQLSHAATAFAEYTSVTEGLRAKLPAIDRNATVLVNSVPLEEYNSKERRWCEQTVRTCEDVQWILDVLEQSPADAEERLRGLFPDWFPPRDTDQ